MAICACPYASPGASAVPSGPVAAVPLTAMTRARAGGPGVARGSLERRPVAVAGALHRYIVGGVSTQIRRSGRSASSLTNRCGRSDG